MSFGGRTFRAFRPSYFGRQDDDLEEDTQQAKQDKMRIYSERAQAGLPLFEPSNVSDRLTAIRNFGVM